MTTGEKIMMRRKRQGCSLEQLGSLVGASPLTVDRWESGLESPSDEDMAKLSEIFGCTADDLTTDSIEFKENIGFERTSRRTVCGIPLWNICFYANSYAEGFIAIGIRAKGVISIGVFSLGLVSAGIFSIGVLTIGIIAIGIFAKPLIGFSFIDGFIPWIEEAWGFFSLLLDPR